MPQADSNLLSAVHEPNIPLSYNDIQPNQLKQQV